jgi:hypothetical protein
MENLTGEILHPNGIDRGGLTRPPLRVPDEYVERLHNGRSDSARAYRTGLSLCALAADRLPELADGSQTTQEIALLVAATVSAILTLRGQPVWAGAGRTAARLARWALRPPA